MFYCLKPKANRKLRFVECKFFKYDRGETYAVSFIRKQWKTINIATL